MLPTIECPTHGHAPATGPDRTCGICANLQTARRLRTIEATDVVTLRDRVDEYDRPIGFVVRFHDQIPYAYVSWVGATIFGDRLEAVPTRYLHIVRKGTK